MTIDIQSPDFIQNFRMSDATIGQIGYGFIGNAVVELFRPFCNVLVYDKNKDTFNNPTHNARMADLSDVISGSEVIFVAVPTPMKQSGECHTAIVESVLQDIQNAAVSLEKNLGSFVVVIKSTVPPGFTARMQKKFALRLLFSPEFLTEANAVSDFKTTNRVILGGEEEDARVVYKYFEGVWPDRQMNTYNGHKDGVVHIIQCDSTVAEMVKLSTNAHLASKVLVSNELYLICQKLGIVYDDVKLLTQFDRRIGLNHMNVPGSDGNLGFGGHCLPKDLNSLAFISEQLKTSFERSCGASGCSPGETSLFRDLVDRNYTVRENHDWEAQKGRAVIDE